MIPLLYECELEASFRAVWCVGSSRETQLRRLVDRGHTAAEAQQRLESQWPVAAKMARATVALWNEGSLETLARQVQLFA